MENTEKVATERKPLGQVLREIVGRVKIQSELDALSDVLIDLANKGNTRAQFSDLRKYVPSIVNAGGLDDVIAWANLNELHVAGQINNSTSAWEYTISWE